MGKLIPVAFPDNKKRQEIDHRRPFPTHAAQEAPKIASPLEPPSKFSFRATLLYPPIWLLWLVNWPLKKTNSLLQKWANKIWKWGESLEKKQRKLRSGKT